MMWRTTPPVKGPELCLAMRHKRRTKLRKLDAAAAPPGGCPRAQSCAQYKPRAAARASAGDRGARRARSTACSTAMKPRSVYTSRNWASLVERGEATHCSVSSTSRGTGAYRRPTRGVPGAGDAAWALPSTCHGHAGMRVVRPMLARTTSIMKMKKKRPSLMNDGIDGDVNVAAKSEPPAIGPRAKPSKPRVEPIPRLRPASSGAAVGGGGGRGGGVEAKG